MSESIFWIIVELIMILLDTFYTFYYIGNYKKKYESSKIFWSSVFLFGICVLYLTFVAHMSVRMIITTFLLIIILKTLYCVSPKEILYLIISLVLILSVCEIITTLFLMLILQETNLENFAQSGLLRLQGMILSKTFTFFFIWIVKKVQVKYVRKMLWQEFMIVVIPFVCNIMVLEYLFNIMYDTTENYKIFTLGLISIVVLFSSISSLLLSEHLFAYKDKEVLYEKIEYSNHIRLNYYENKKISEEEIRKMYHDMKNHLLYIENKEISDISRNYLDAVHNSIDKYEDFIETHNDFLNVIINEKITLAKKNEIRMDCMIDFKNCNFIEPIDICAIFGNALDNAIEACLRIMPSTQRYIDVRAKLYNNYCIVKVTNSNRNIIKLNKLKLPETLKEDKMNHGIGLVSLKSAVAKYNGKAIFEEKEDQFILKILIPLSNLSN